MPHGGNSGQRNGVKSERRPVTGSIAFQDLRRPEREQTYTAVSVCKERRNFMNKGEGGLKSEYTEGTSGSRTANLDGTGKENRNSASLKWETIDWFKVETFINKAQARIASNRRFAATVEGNMKLVRELSRMLTHSYYAKLWAIRKVTSTTGKRTAGIDNEKWSTPAQKYQAVSKLEKNGYKAKALKRVYITKSNGKKRPLGIPTMTDRAMQALMALALDPIIESISDKRSFGFRKGRSCQDACEQLFKSLSQKISAQWVVEGDIKACFDEIAHDWLLQHIPMDKQILKQFLKAGYVYEHQLFPTDCGTPQGGIISPLLANAALNGLEELLRKETVRMRYREKVYPKINLVRYADDFVITAKTEEIAERVTGMVRQFMAERGLQLSEEKTVITHISEGFDFLGWNVKKYRNGKVLTKPSKKSRQKVLEKIRTVIRNHRGAKQDDLIAKLNPIIRGWTQYHRTVVAKRIFSTMDKELFRLLWEWARKRHGNKGRWWISRRYWKTEGTKHWVFKDTLTLLRFCDTRVRRHIPLQLEKNPYLDGEYFQRRRYRLLVNRTLGRILPEGETRNETGSRPANGCLSEA
jgi:RNA-directed DNA polymerase